MKKLSRIFLITSIFLGAVINNHAQPFITRQPTNQSVSLGASVKFLVSATSTNPPILFQWRAATINVTTATNSILTLTNVQITVARDYDVVLTDGGGSVTSQVAHLEVDSTFTKITTGPVVTDVQDSVGATWADIDGDGYLDLSVAGFHSNQNLFYHNDGIGGFIPIQITPTAASELLDTTVQWGDFDNDGRLDLFVCNGTGAHALYRQTTDGTFVQSKLPAGSGQGAAAAADYDGDGLLDIMTVGASANILWHNDGLGKFSHAQKQPATVVDAFTVSWADFDNDGFPDVFLTHLQGNSQLLRNDRKGGFIPITTGPLAADGGSTLHAAWADYNNDGFLDLLVDHDSQAQNLRPRLYRNNGDGNFTQVSPDPFPETGGLRFAWGDYDNDGWIDLFICEHFGGGQWLYHNNADGTFTKVSAGSMTTDRGMPSVAIWGDYDRDGFLDLLVSNRIGPPGNGVNFLYHNEGNSNSWIEVKCVGTRSNRSAVGAKVRVKATVAGKPFWQMREINTGDGYAGGTLEAHFGLGSATNVETVRIEWPSGTVQELKNVAAKQFLTVTEPSRLLISATNGIPQLTLQGGRNLQYDLQSSTNLTAWSLIGTLTITNLNGTALITDTNPPASGSRYYRAVLH